MSDHDKQHADETPTERLLREALDARALQVTAQSLRPAAPPKIRIRRIRPVATVAVPLFGLAAGVLGYFTLDGTPTALHQEQPPAAILSGTPLPSPSPSPSPSESASTSPSAPESPSPSSSPSGSPSPSASQQKLNGTSDSGLTISNGTQYVVMNGTVKDFGTSVRDLAWSPDGKKAAFVGGNGDLVVSNPDGSGQVTVAKNPGGQVWSHPTWLVPADQSRVREASSSFLIFAADQSGTSRLEWVPSTAANGTPQQLGLSNYPEAAALPQTGNLWPNAGGNQGSSVYTNADNGNVYIRDDNLRQQGGPLTQGSEPALSPDGFEAVFVRSVDGHDHIFSDDLRTQTVKDLTPHATVDYTEPVFSPDGKTVATRTPDGIATLPADGTVAPTHVSDYPGLPAYRP